MAFTKSLKFTCEREPCSKRALEEVFNRYNAPLGRYCRRHAGSVLRAIQEREKRLSRERK